MAIIANRRTTYCQNWKGFPYGKTTFPDQIAINPGKAGPKNRSRGSADVLRPPQPTRLYPSSAFCNPDPSSILQHRLSWHCRTVARAQPNQKRPEPDQDTALYNPAKGSAKDVKKNIFQGLLRSIFDQAQSCGLVNRSSAHTCCIDSTGLENHYVSRHFLSRRGKRTRKYRRWTKLTIVCENKSHLIVSAIVSAGPSTDCHYLELAVANAVEHLPITTLLADSGFDAEYNHRLCRDKFGIRSAVIKVNDRNLKYSQTKGLFRRMMKERFPAKKYGQRWQIEAVFSRFKRRLGNALTARTNVSRIAEVLLRVLTYNLMVVLLTFQKSYLLIFSTEHFES
jgi:hypothetical protein